MPCRGDALAVLLVAGFQPPGRHPAGADCHEFAALADLPLLSAAQVAALAQEPVAEGPVAARPRPSSLVGGGPGPGSPMDLLIGMPMAHFKFVIRNMLLKGQLPRRRQRQGQVPRRRPPPLVPAAAGGGGGSGGGGEAGAHCAGCGNLQALLKRA